MSFYVENFGQFITLVCRSIHTICPQADYLMRFWQIKHAEDPELAKQGLLMEGRDSYERTDNYNAYGLFCYFALRMRQDFFKWTGMPTPANENILVHTEFVPTTHEYTYELF